MEVRWLDAYGTKMIAPGSLVFHKWIPFLGTKESQSLFRSFFIRLRGLPIHLWNEDSFHFIVGKCGGLKRIDDHSLGSNFVAPNGVSEHTPLCVNFQRTIDLSCDSGGGRRLVYLFF